MLPTHYSGNTNLESYGTSAKPLVRIQDYEMRDMNMRAGKAAPRIIPPIEALCCPSQGSSNNLGT